MQTGIYRITKPIIEFDHTVEVRNGRTEDGWYLAELVLMGYTFKKIGELPVVKTAHENADQEGETNYVD